LPLRQSADVEAQKWCLRYQILLRRNVEECWNDAELSHNEGYAYNEGYAWRLSRGYISNVSGTAEDIKLKLSASVEWQFEKTNNGMYILMLLLLLQLLLPLELREFIWSFQGALYTRVKEIHDFEITCKYIHTILGTSCFSFLSNFPYVWKVGYIWKFSLNSHNKKRWF